MSQIIETKEGVAIGLANEEYLIVLDFMQEVLKFANKQFEDGKHPSFSDARSPEELAGQMMTIQCIQMIKRLEDNPEMLEELKLSMHLQENPTGRSYDSMYS